MEITIQRAVPADADALVQVEIAAFHDDTRLYGVELGGPPGYDQVDVMLDKIARHQSYTIRVDGRIVGGIVLYDQGAGHYHLDLIFVDPALHGHGIGSQAMRLLEASYPASTRWTLDTPLYAVRNQHFYEKFGYVKVREYDDDGFMLIAYEKRV